MNVRARRTRRAILTSGIELLTEHGVRGVTVEGISRETGIAKTTIYRYWSTRELLVSAVISEVRFDVPTPETGDALRDIEVILTAMWRLVSEPSHRVTLASMIEESGDPSLGSLHTEFLLASGRPVLEVLERGVRTGELDADLDLEYSFRMLTGPVMAGAFILGAPLDDAFVKHLVRRVLGEREA